MKKLPSVRLNLEDVQFLWFQIIQGRWMSARRCARARGYDYIAGAK